MNTLMKADEPSAYMISVNQNDGFIQLSFIIKNINIFVSNTIVFIF